MSRKSSIIKMTSTYFEMLLCGKVKNKSFNLDDSEIFSQVLASGCVYTLLLAVLTSTPPAVPIRVQLWGYNTVILPIFLDFDILGGIFRF